MNPGNLLRRPVNNGDRALLFALYASTREAELALVPWTAEQKLAFAAMQFDAQTTSYRDAHPDGLHEVITRGDVPVGRIYWSRLPDRIHILDVTVASNHRNQGIGTQVLGEIIEEADRTGKSLTIYVESFNPSCRFFQRLGFRIASQDGFQLLLERPAASASQPA